jgi:hypothetical protein
MKYLVPLVLLVVSSCASVDHSKALHVRAYSPDGKAGPTDLTRERYDEEFYKNGVVFEFHAGDIIHYDFKPEGDLLEFVEGGRLRVKRTTYVHMSKRGPEISVDGKHFSRFPRRSSPFSVDLLVCSEPDRNQIDFTMEAKAP